MTLNRATLLEDEQRLLYHLADLVGDHSVEDVWHDPESPEFKGYLRTSFQGLLDQLMVRPPQQYPDIQWRYRSTPRGWMIGIKRARLDDASKDFARPPKDVADRIQALTTALKWFVHGRSAPVPVDVPVEVVEAACGIPRGWIRNSIDSHMLQYHHRDRLVNCAYLAGHDGDNQIRIPTTFMQLSRRP